MQTRDSWFDLMREVAHDLNLPLTAASGFIQLVDKFGPLNDRQSQYVQRALASLDHMERLVGMLLDIAWLDAGRAPDFKQCDLARVIRDAVVMVEGVAGQRGITVESSVPDDLGALLADTNRITQAVNNLLGNAVKYNRDNGTVWVSAQGDTDSIFVTVRDSGLGIPAEAVPHLFDPYYRVQGARTANIEGTGLGLAIVKGVIEKHHGRIWVESTPDEGSAFHFTLPRRPEPGEGAHDGYERHPHEHTESVSVPTPDSQKEVSDPVDDNLQESPYQPPDEIDRV